MKQRKKIDPYLRTMPWRVYSVFEPIERVLHRMEADGTVDVERGNAVFREDSKGGWYEIVPAIAGVVEFHQIAATRHGLGCDVEGLVRLAKKLDHGAPIFESDLVSVRASISSCKAQAMKLRASQAQSIVSTVQISMHLDDLKAA